MQAIRIGPWELHIPADWSEKKNDDAPYLESSDETVGCYLKLLKYKDSGLPAQKISDEIQSIHEHSFRDAAKGHWQVMAQGSQRENLYVRSRLDMYNRESQYRILSLVLASDGEALQLSIHNYLCQDYARDRDTYEAIALSLRRAT